MLEVTGNEIQAYYCDSMCMYAEILIITHIHTIESSRQDFGTRIATSEVKHHVFKMEREGNS